MKPRSLTILALILAGLLVGLATTLIFHFNFLVFMTVAASIVYVGVPLAIIAAATFFLSFRYARIALRWSAAIAFGLFLFLILQIPFLVGAFFLSERDTVLAQEYCENLIPILEAHKTATGDYPESLADLTEPLPKPIPRPLRKLDFYSAEPDVFEFNFSVEQSMLSTIFDYSSRTRCWEVD